jgi:hypothetical protein
VSNRINVIWIIIICLGGCKPLSQNEFTNWISDLNNGCHVTKEVGKFVLDIQYIPDMAERKTTAGKKVMLKIATVEGEDLLQQGVATSEDWQKANYYYSFNFQEDLFIEVDGKRVPCSLFHFEKSMTSKNQRIFHLLFDDTSAEKDFYLVIDSPKLYSLPIRVKLRNSDLPKVATS